MRDPVFMLTRAEVDQIVAEDPDVAPPPPHARRFALCDGVLLWSGDDEVWSRPDLIAGRPIVDATICPPHQVDRGRCVYCGEVAE